MEHKKDMVLISKSELKDLIKSSLREELEIFYPKYEMISDAEQQEINKIFGEKPVILNSDEYIKL